jgi:hypothetical protein
MGPVLRTISLIRALALTGVGAYHFFDLLFYHPRDHGGRDGSLPGPVLALD